MGVKYDLADLVNVIEHNIRSEVHTFMPGKIVKYYPDTQTADVQLMLSRVHWDDEDAEDGTPAGHKVYTRYPLLPNIPVEFPGAGDFVLTFPVNPGDTCDVEFAESSIADYLATGDEVKQQDVGRHELGYAVVHPVYCPTDDRTIDDPDVVANNRLVLGKLLGKAQIQLHEGDGVTPGDRTYLRFGKGDTSIVCTEADPNTPGDKPYVVIASGTDFAALASKVDAAVEAVRAAFNNHSHKYVPYPGGSAGAPVDTTGNPTLSAQPSTAAAVTKLK